MAKAGKKRSAARAPAKRRPRKAPPEQLPGPEWHKAFEPLSARTGQFRLPQEMVERFRRQFQQQPTDTTRIDRAIAHGAGMIPGAGTAPAGQSSAPAADHGTPKTLDVKAWFASALINHARKPGERIGVYAKRLCDMQEAAGVAKPWPLKTVRRRLYK